MKGVELATLVQHVRKMIATTDPLSILVRGMILIDNARDDLIDAYSAVPYQTIDGEFKHPTLLQRTILACALGAISEGELVCIRRINQLRNGLAHRIPVDVTAEHEESVVKVFRENTKLFSGLDYNKDAFPRAFIFLLMVLFFLLSSRCGRLSDLKIKHMADETNTGSMLAISLTRVIVHAATEATNLTDEQISTC